MSSFPPDSLATGSGDMNAPFINKPVGEFLKDTAQHHPSRKALIVPASETSDERSWTYAELLHASQQTAQALLDHFEPGDRVATWAGGSPEVVVLQFGAALAGIVLVTLNPANRALEIEYTLNQAQTRGLFLDRVYRGMDNEAVIESIRNKLPLLQKIVYFDEWDAFNQTDGDKPLPDVKPDAPALILFTSGSSGKPKSATLRHAGIINNAALGARRLGVPDGAVWLNVLPMFHVGGSVTMTLGCMSVAGTQILFPQFNPDEMLAAVGRYNAYLTMAVPTMLVALLESSAIEKSNLSALQLIVVGGSAVAPDLIRRVKRKMGADVASLMGQTEASGAMFSTRRGDSDEQIAGSVGAPIDLTEVKIIDSKDGSPQSVGEPGEICIRSPMTMSGYFEMPEKTAATLEQNGWLHTGDVGLMRPDGYIQVTGRLSDMIIRGGENIYPREIEDVMMEHPDIGQVAVYGVPDEKWGEQVAAAVVPRPGKKIAPDELTAWLQARIARHRTPKIWRILETLPINASGKVQKFVLQEQHIAGAKPD